MGGLFIAVVVAFPRGLAGVMTDQIIPRSWIVEKLRTLESDSVIAASPARAGAGRIGGS